MFFKKVWQMGYSFRVAKALHGDFDKIRYRDVIFPVLRLLFAGKIGQNLSRTADEGQRSELSFCKENKPKNSGSKERSAMKAIVDGHVVAESNDVIECKGYQYFPRAAVRLDWLEKVAKTEDDRACPHGVQFYDVLADGRRHKRAAWCYEAPRPEMQQVRGRFSFWQDIKVM